MVKKKDQKEEEGLEATLKRRRLRKENIELRRKVHQIERLLEKGGK
jgi:hypothetical protein